MKPTTQQRRIFKRGSTTYFYSSLFFPPDVKADVFTLYAFVRTADDFVDSTPQEKEGFELFVKHYRQALKGTPSGNLIIDDFVALSKRKQFDPRWTESFLAAMRSDLAKRTYASLKETEQYMYGSAEVIGLYLSAIFGLSKDAQPSAQLLGKAFQYVNFLRDIAEDNALGRTYIPQAALKKHGLPDLREATARKNPEAFCALIRDELLRYEEWQRQAERGFHYLPRKLRIPVKTASDLYYWSARKIHENPFIVFERKVKPRKSHVVLVGLKNLVLA